MRNAKNRRLFKEARKVIPGGVNSPVRAFKAVGPEPIFIDRAKGAYLYDADGNRYIDYCLSWGPMILGHACREVISEVGRAMKDGTSYGIPTEQETVLARMIVGAIESVEKVRLVSSGTEAAMTAIRLARGATGRDKVVKFVGCYHGHVDHLLVQAGSGPLTLGTPSSPGVPKDFTKNTIMAAYNDLEHVKKIFAKYGDRIAAIIVEPVAGNMGVIKPSMKFLKGLRTLCNKNKSILVFDEVITGFRVAYGGVQKEFGVKADLTCLGKIIGGGFPIGAVGGKAGIMDHLSPQGSVYQAGTLSGNPVCVAAGIATLKLLKDQKVYRRLEKKTKAFCASIADILNSKGIEHTINRVGSMFTLFFGADAVSDLETAFKSDTDRYGRYFSQMLNGGIYLPPSQFEANFLSTAHSDGHLEKTLGVIKKVSL